MSEPDYIICSCGGIYIEEDKEKHYKRPMHQIWKLKNEMDKVREELYRTNEKIDELHNEVSKREKKMNKYLDKNNTLKAYLSERIEEHNSK
jgi:prefoldin subunit 5